METIKIIATGVTVFCFLIVVVLVGFGLAKLASRLFDASPSLDQQSIQICGAKGGTPILEGTGTAYKSCAINGKSHTENYVKH